MGSRLPDPIHFSLPDALTSGLDIMELPKIQLPEIDLRQTRWSLLGGITIWFLHLNLLNSLVSLSCRWDWFSFKIAGLSGLQFIEALITLVALVLMLILIYLPWLNWQHYQTGKPPDNPRMLQDTEQDRRPLAAFVTMLLNSLFFLFIIASFVPLFTLSACRQG